MGGSLGFHSFECIHRDIRHAGGRNGGSRRNGRASRRGGWVHHDDGSGISTRLLIRAFVSKMVVFGAYVVLATVVMALDVVAFFVSFTLYFVALYLVETFYVYQLCVSNRTS